ncbi:DUF7002 family protein [Alicyclobacillus ferrooxydans]|uniref:DarT domain-containing protein n=1 Tax=Alicyclobacillus ferrooxydans TaxID=471514 RepID=A0A0P9CK73_9BACL|nr:hypothetical protein [Alicyclobacillus ferrooxydans]KPV45694.1 hypothetical protein AN477_01970 [Alicyclobacillus ferrooxydans]
MNLRIVQRITNTPKRKSLYHFTRVDNLASIAASGALYASDVIQTNPNGERRPRTEIHEIDDHQVILNAHLQISPDIMDADTSVGQFRAFLDEHVFLWPTLRLYQQMLQMYTRREPGEQFAVLQLGCLYSHDQSLRPSSPFQI